MSMRTLILRLSNILIHQADDDVVQMIELIDQIKAQLPTSKNDALGYVQDVLNSLSRDHNGDDSVQMGLIMARSMIPDILESVASRPAKPADINQCLLLLGEYISTGKPGSEIEEMRKYLIGDIATLPTFNDTMKALIERVANDPVASFHAGLVADYFKPVSVVEPPPIAGGSSEPAVAKEIVRFDRLLDLLVKKAKDVSKKNLYQTVMREFVSFCKSKPREWYTQQIDRVMSMQYDQADIMAVIMELMEKVG